MDLDKASLFVSPYDVRARDAPLRRSPFLKYIFYFYQLANKLKGCKLPPGVFCLNRYKAKVGYLQPPAVMECLLTSIIHWLIPGWNFVILP